jgi:hypothetical protein
MRGYGTVWEAIRAVVAADYCDERGEGTVLELEDGSFAGHVTDEGTLSERMTAKQREQGIELMLTPTGIEEAPASFNVMWNAGPCVTERGAVERPEIKCPEPAPLNIPEVLASPAFRMPEGIELAVTQDGATAADLASDRNKRRGVWVWPSIFPRVWNFYVTRTLTSELLGVKVE